MSQQVMLWVKYIRMIINSEEKENELGAVAIEVAVVPEKELEKPKVLTKNVPTIKFP